MTDRFLLFAFADNFVVWGIVALALFCYLVEIDLILAQRDAHWKRQAGTWLTVLPILISALPRGCRWCESITGLSTSQSVWGSV